MEEDQHAVHQQCGGDGLDHSNGEGLSPGLFQGAQTELIADGKGDEAEGNVGNQGKAVQCLVRGKADAGDVEPAKKKGPDQKAGNQIGCDIRQAEAPDQAGHHQACKQRKCERQQDLHKNVLPSGHFCNYSF